MPNTEFNLEKLKGAANYHNWSFALENFLESRTYAKAIKPMKDDETKAVEKDEDKLSKAKGLLVMSIEPALFVHIRTCKTALEIWTKLKSMYEDRGLTRKIGLLRTLISMRLETSGTMQAYIDSVMDTASKLDSIDFKVEDDWLAAILLAGLTDEYKPLIMSFEAQDGKLSAETIKMKLLDTECSATESQNNALLSKKKGKQSKQSKQNRHKGKKCFVCDGDDHISTNCVKKQQQQQKNTSTAKRAFITRCSQKWSDDWYVDSGASSHMTPNVSLLSNCKRTTINEILTANDEQMLVKCSGDAKLSLNAEEVSVNNVMYVPDLSANLLSVSQMVRAGNSLVFDKTGCTVYDKDNISFAHCKPINGVYCFQSSMAKCMMSAQEQNSALTWHRRFGHLNTDSLKRMRDGIVTGMHFKDAKITISNCKICAMGKQPRLPFKPSQTQTKSILEIIHSDLAGPMETTSIGGAKYLLTFIDDFSRKVFIYFLRQKSEVLDRFIEFKAFVEKQTEKSIKIFRTDNGTEYCSRLFNNFCKVNGIQHQLTNAHTPEQNGVAERMNRTIVEKAKCMIFDAGLDDSYWAEACNMAVYVINRSVCASLVNKTPEEVWTNQKVDVSNLKIFGTPVMVHVPKARRKKWSPKAKSMIFVGFDSDKKGYRCLDENKKLVISRDVVFNEQQLSSHMSYIDEDVNQVREEAEIDPHQVEENLEQVRESSICEVSTPIESTSANESSTSFQSAEGDPIEDDTLTELPNLHDDDENDPTFSTRAKLPIESRKSSREPKQRTFEGYVSHFAFKCTNHFDPNSVNEAFARNDANLWKDAMKDEMRSLDENRTWNLVELPQGRKAIKTKWIFKTKRDENGKILRYKARFVAKGCAQKYGLDYVETFAPVVRYSTLRLLIAVAVKKGLKIHQMDAITAFLQGDLDEELYIEQPEGFTDGTNRVGKLNRAMYGLKQAGRQWNQKLVKALKSFDLMQSKIDPCVFYNHNLDLMVAIYVDDILIFWRDNETLMKIKQSLSNTFKMKDMGLAKHCLNIRLNQGDGFIELDQSIYIKLILERFNMQDSKPVFTPQDTSVKLSVKAIPDEVIDESALKQIPYQEAVGCLLYLSQCTRPDIANAVVNVSRFNTNYRMTHWTAVKRIFRYLNGTINLKLRYSYSAENLSGYTDADWASDVDKRRSCTGYVFMLSNAAVTWHSGYQKTVAKSTGEAEYMALSDGVAEALWLKQLLREIDPRLNDTTLIKCDSKSAIDLANTDAYRSNTKHIDIRYHFIRDEVQRRTIRIEHISTQQMVADNLTKAVPSDKHSFCVTKCGLF